jgi:glycosyltransferase involved in cell wall biosynthesis
LSKRKKGMFVNQKDSKCSIYESGKMMYDILKEFEFLEYSLDYFETDSTLINVPMRSYDFSVINWHNHTLPVERYLLDKLHGKKIAVVVEVSPSKYLPFTPDWFDGYAVIDPTKARKDNFFPLPRPILKGNILPLLDKNKLTFGSFGLFSGNFKDEKRFYEIVDAANSTGKECIVRINLPVATYTYTPMSTIVSYTDSLKKRANSKVKVLITHDYMSREGLISWLSQHNINCFPYYRNRPGLSAVTDQAVSADRAIMTTECDTFRHLHKYISYYPKQSYLELMTSTLSGVKQMQYDWSPEKFKMGFDNMLRELNII